MKKKNRQLRLLSVCRDSSREQSEGYSLGAQDQANREWAERKGHEIVETIRYVETASKQKDRQRFREIVNRICSDPTINGVVFHKVDRACRNLTDLAILERLETQKDKKVFFSSQEFPQNAAGRLGIGVMGVVARWYTDNLKEEINKGFRSKVEAGEYPHIPPYGYCMGHGSNGSKLPLPDPPEGRDSSYNLQANVIRQAYHRHTPRRAFPKRHVFFPKDTTLDTFPSGKITTPSIL